MKLATSIDGFELIPATEKNVVSECLENIQSIGFTINKLLPSLLMTLKIVDKYDKNSTARTIRLLTKLEKQIDNVRGYVEKNNR